MRDIGGSIRHYGVNAICAGRYAICATLLAACVSGSAGQQAASLEPLIQQALDEPVELVIDDHRPLAEVFRIIGETTGLKLRLSHAALGSTSPS